MDLQIEKPIKILRMAARSLLQHKLRSILSVLGIVCGVMAVLSMISIGEGAKREIIRQIEALGTRNIYLKAVALTVDQRQKAQEQLSSGLTVQTMKRIVAGCPDLRMAAALKEVAAFVSDIPPEVTPQIIAVSESYGQIQDLSLSQGRMIGPMDVYEKNMVCVLGHDVAGKMGSKAVPGEVVRIESHLFKIVGIMKRHQFKASRGGSVSGRNYNEMIIIPLGTEVGLARFVQGEGPGKHEHQPTDVVTEMVLQVHRTDQVLNAARVVHRILDIAQNQVKDFQMIVPLELLHQARKTQQTFNWVLGAIACVSLLVGGIGIMNIMLASVTERIREIGIRRAVGACRNDIIVQFLVEAVILTLTGGVIGVAVGVGAVAAIAKISGWSIAITTWAVAAPLVMSVMAGLFFGLYPAVQAAHMDPVAALRHE